MNFIIEVPYLSTHKFMTFISFKIFIMQRAYISWDLFFIFFILLLVFPQLLYDIYPLRLSVWLIIFIYFSDTWTRFIIINCYNSVCIKINVVISDSFMWSPLPCLSRIPVMECLIADQVCAFYPHYLSFHQCPTKNLKNI